MLSLVIVMKVIIVVVDGRGCRVSKGGMIKIIKMMVKVIKINRICITRMIKFKKILITIIMITTLIKVTLITTISTIPITITIHCQ